jgi:hypothetical protein
MAADGFAYISANVGANEPSRATTLTTVNLNVGVARTPQSMGFAAIDHNVGVERTLQPTSFAAVDTDITGSTGITRWHNGYREALYAKGLRLNGATVPLIVKGHWNASTQKVDPLT